jgi:predicted metal-binding membrane protein
VLKSDRVIVLGALFIIVTLSWLYLLSGAGMDMSALETAHKNSGDAGIAMVNPVAWDISYATLMFFMWWVMMIAMMLPSATPMILLFAAINRKQEENGNPFVHSTIFILAYLVVWAGFSLLAVATQWGFEHAELLTPMIKSSSNVLGGILLLSAGVYQLTPIKQACLKHCRSPLQFVMTRWRSGTLGAFRMGTEHGVYCVGCCWFLMGLLFFGGVMNFFWIAGLAIFVLLEKSIPLGHWAGIVLGVVLMIWGIAMLIGTLPL